MKYFAAILLLLSVSLKIAYVEGIVNGKLAPLTPHQVALFANGEFHCGGTLIGQRTILTAANCVYYKQLPHTSYNPPKLQAHYGSSEFSKGIEVGVSEVFIHPHYRYYREPEYDLAVLHLSEPFQASANASTIAMTSVSPPIGSFVNVTGWGRPNEIGPFSAHLQAAENMVIVSRTVCAAEWPHVIVNEAILCAKNSAQKQAICSGDSGSGLTQNGRLVGVASFASPECTAFSLPNGFADVANLREFINKHLL